MFRYVSAFFVMLVMLQIHCLAEENTEEKQVVKEEKPLDEKDLMKIIVDFHKFAVKKGSRRSNETINHQRDVEKSLQGKLVHATLDDTRIKNDGTTVRFRSKNKRVAKSGKNDVYVYVIIDLKCKTKEDANATGNIASGKITGVGISGGCGINHSKMLGISVTRDDN